MNQFAILYTERFTREAWGNERRLPFAGAWRRAQPRSNCGSSPCSPQVRAARGSGPAASGEFDRGLRATPVEWQVGMEEQAL